MPCTSPYIQTAPTAGSSRRVFPVKPPDWRPHRPPPPINQSLAGADLSRADLGPSPLHPEWIRPHPPTHPSGSRVSRIRGSLPTGSLTTRAHCCDSCLYRSHAHQRGAADFFLLIRPFFSPFSTPFGFFFPFLRPSSPWPPVFGVCRSHFLWSWWLARGTDCGCGRTDTCGTPPSLLRTVRPIVFDSAVPADPAAFY